jgi:Uma2 family endonuclease
MILERTVEVVERDDLAPIRARHGVPEVWILDLAARAVEVHRDPKPDGYARAATLGPGETAEPALLPGLRLSVEEIIG